MNWGLKITLLYVGFVAMILTLVFKASGEKVELVTTDYYAKELVHQTKMDALSRALPYKEEIKVNVTANTMELAFPNAIMPESGTIGIYRPSDAAQDKTIAIALSEGQQVINTTGWMKGYYRINLTWMAKGVEYQFEDTFFIP